MKCALPQSSTRAGVSRLSPEALGARPRRAWRQRGTRARCFTNAGVVCLGTPASPHRLPRLSATPTPGRLPGRARRSFSLKARNTSRESVAASGAELEPHAGFSIGRMSGKGHSRTCSRTRVVERNGRPRRRSVTPHWPDARASAPGRAGASGRSQGCASDGAEIATASRWRISEGSPLPSTRRRPCWAS
jgi:hypothetical protein